MSNSISIYIHIPFCKSKCIYCDFVSFPNCEKFFDTYLEKVKQEIDYHASKLKNRNVKTIFIGGGTPSLLGGEDIFNLVTFVLQKFSVSKQAEITIEVNPESFTKEKALWWKKAGINRFSFGLQSDDDVVLKKLGRIHNFSQFQNAVKEAKSLSFSNISADVLLGLPNQTPQKIRQTLRKIAKLGLAHISAYGLQVEKGTKLFELVKNEQIKLPDEDLSNEIYNSAYLELKELGFHRYEISNFAKKGFECRHNQNYWIRGEFLGIGAGAYGFIDGAHYENTSNLIDYIKKDYVPQNIEKESKKTKMEETIMLALRTEKGLNISNFNKTFNIDFCEKFKPALDKLSQQKLIKTTKNHIKITNFSISNAIILQFFMLID